MDYRYEVDPRESNGYVTDDVICGVKKGTKKQLKEYRKK